jgi:hypothetical protein
VSTPATTVDAPPKAPLTPARPGLSFATVDDIIADIANLRRSWRKSSGEWSLGQIAWHCAVPLERVLSQPVPTRTEQTPEEAANFRKFQEMIAGRAERQLTAPPFMQPPVDADDADVDRVLGLLAKLNAYPHSHVTMYNNGPVPIGEYVAFQLGHFAHHLSQLAPSTVVRRKGLTFASPDDVIADVRRLQKGYEQAGNWNLNHVAWHLDQSTRFRFKPGPFPPTTPEQDARKPVLDKLLATGKLPDGIPVPDPIRPPADAGPEAIERLVEAMEMLKAFKGEFWPHRLFGQMSDEQSRRILMIHSAHHLSYQVPTHG